MPVTTERRTRRRLALRESILDAARTVMRDEGLAALTMRRIAEAIDYSPASIYAHFASRDALLAALCAEGLTAMRIALEAVAGVRDPRARLVALGTAYVAFALERRDTYRLIFMEDGALTKRVFESVDSTDGARAMALLHEPFAELRENGTMKKTADPVLLADLFFVTMHGLASLRLSCPMIPPTADATLIAAAAATIVDGLRTRPKA